MNELHTKNTAVKISHKGSGFSHKIKEFLENKAKELNMKKIVHYCRIDNFRMYSLNESHGYNKTKNTFGEGQIIEWEKKLKQLAEIITTNQLTAQGKIPPSFINYATCKHCGLVPVEEGVQATVDWYKSEGLI